MDKIISIIIFAFLGIYADAQNVLGLNFGDSKETVDSILCMKYGKPDISDRDVIIYNSKDYAGHKFTSMSFHFQYGNSRSYLSNVLFNIEQKDEALAKEIYTEILSKIKDKYHMEKKVDELFGDEYYANEKENVKLFFRPSLSPNTPCNIALNYGPYIFVSEEL